MPKVTMERETLLKALRAVMPGTRDNPLIPGADSFVFRGGMVQSYNDHLSISYPLDTGLEGAVKGEELFRVVEKMPSEQVDLEMGDRCIRVSGKRKGGATKLSCSLVEFGGAKLLDALELDSLEWGQVPPGLAEALGLCLPSVSKNPSHGGLVGIHVSGADVMSSDNFRATWVTLASPVPQALTVPGASVSDLLNLEGLEQYAATQSWIHFMSKEGAVFSSRLIASQFPHEALKRMFPDDSGKMYQMPEDMEGALERVGILSSRLEGGDYVTIERDGSQLVIRGEREFASIRDEIELATEWPEGVSITIQPKYLLSILGKTRAFQMHGKLAHFQGKGFRHIISTVAT